MKPQLTNTFIQSLEHANVTLEPVRFRHISRAIARVLIIFSASSCLIRDQIIISIFANLPGSVFDCNTGSGARLKKLNF
jgi:hypothetical protein